MTVFVVMLCNGTGSVAGVFKTLTAASTYVEKHAYNTYVITEHVVVD